MLGLQLRRGRFAVQSTGGSCGRELHGDVGSAVGVQRSFSWPHSLLQKLKTAL
jgi:hypothetical protein